MSDPFCKAQQFPTDAAITLFISLQNLADSSQIGQPMPEGGKSRAEPDIECFPIYYYLVRGQADRHPERPNKTATYYSKKALLCQTHMGRPTHAAFVVCPFSAHIPLNEVKQACPTHQTPPTKGITFRSFDVSHKKGGQSARAMVAQKGEFRLLAHHKSRWESFIKRELSVRKLN